MGQQIRYGHYNARKDRLIEEYFQLMKEYRDSFTERELVNYLWNIRNTMEGAKEFILEKQTKSILCGGI